jgi:pimeloyl-ACP methyl ester carboxylesterase
MVREVARMQVFLLHGMGRSPASLALLEWRLARAGMRTSQFGYRVTQHDLAQIGARFGAHVRRVATGPYAIVGHSLGNVIARIASPTLPEGLAGVVMLAPPNRSPRLARRFHRLPIYDALFRDAGQRLADPAFFEQLPVPAVPTLIFAGSVGPRAAWLPFEGAMSDSVVAVDETTLADAEHRVVPALHTFIMNDAQVTRAIVDFLGRVAPA